MRLEDCKTYLNEEDAFPIFVEDGQLCFIHNRGMGESEYTIRYSKRITERIRKALLKDVLENLELTGELGE